ncbi:hypothetical protein ACLIA0_10715 [Bacillaceae bacterium W0354]
MLITASIQTKKLGADKSHSKFSDYFLYFAITLVVVFSLAGGKSQSGLSLNEPLIWIALALGFLIDRKTNKKEND